MPTLDQITKEHQKTIEEKPEALLPEQDFTGAPLAEPVIPDMAGIFAETDFPLTGADPQSGVYPPDSLAKQAEDTIAIANQRNISIAEAENFYQENGLKESYPGHLAHGWLRLAIGFANIPQSMVRFSEQKSPVAFGYNLLRDQNPMETLKGWLTGDFPTPLADFLQRPTDWLTSGAETFIENHPEWKGKPAEGFIDLVTNPRKWSYAITESIPMLIGAGLLTAAGHPAAAFSVAYAAEGQEAYDEALADTGDRKIAEMARILYGIPAAAIEYAQLNMGLKMVKEFYRAALSRMALTAGKEAIKAGGRKLGKKYLLTILAENVQEWAQGDWQERTMKALYGKEPQGGLIGWLERRAMESAVITPLVTVSGGVGGAVGFAGRVIKPAEGKAKPTEAVPEKPGEVEPVEAEPVTPAVEEEVVEQAPMLEQEVQQFVKDEFDVEAARTLNLVEANQINEALDKEANALIGRSIGLLFDKYPDIGKKLGISRNDIAERGPDFVAELMWDIWQDAKTKGREDFVKEIVPLIGDWVRNDARREIINTRLAELKIEVQPPAPEVTPTVEGGVEKIRAAAYYNPNTGEISEGQTHPEAAAKMKEFYPTIKEGKPAPEGIIEGFVTESGRFVTNKEAEAMAKKSGQLPKDYELTEEERILGRPTAQAILAEEITPPAEPAKPETVETPLEPVAEPTAEEAAKPEYTEPSEEEVKTVNDVMLEQLAEVERIRVTERKPAVRKFRKKQVAKAIKKSEQAAKAGVPAGERIRQSKAGYAGVAESPEYTPPNLTDSQWDVYSRRILNLFKPPGQQFEQTNAQDALDKLRKGQVLTSYEIGLLEWVMGSKVAKAIQEATAPKPTWFDVLVDVLNIPRTMLTAASGDISGIARQGRGLGSAYPVEYARFIKRYVQSWASESFTHELADSTREFRFYADGVKDGIEQTHAGLGAEAIERAEEMIAAPLLEKVPLLKHPVRMAERSYTAALNWFRIAVYDRIRSEAMYVDPETGLEIDTLTEKRRKRIANMINDLSARSHIKRTKAAKAVAPLLNSLFAPRLALSRVKVLGRLPAQVTRGVATGEVRTPEMRMAAGALAGLTATNLLIMGLVKMAAPDEVEIELDPRSADFGKLKIGDMRIDLWIGLLQPVQLFARLVSGQMKTQSGEVIKVDRRDILENGIRKKVNPIVSLVLDAWTSRTFWGARFGAPPKGKAGEILTEIGIPENLQGVSKETWNRLGPMVIQDAIDAWVSEGVPEAALAVFLSHIGVSVSAYEKWATQMLSDERNKMAQEVFGSTWNKLTPDQQEELAPNFEDLELMVDQERALRGPPSVDRILKEQHEVKMRVQEALPKAVRGAMAELGMTVEGVGRKHGKFYLDKERYRLYEELYTTDVKDTLDFFFGNLPDNWDGLSLTEKKKQVTKQIQESKERAKKELLAEINAGNI